MNDSPVPLSTVPCRVCGNATQPFFTKLILGKYHAAYFKCPACGQVQTEPPYWLGEAYARTSKLDVGMAGRCILTAQTTVALARRLGIAPEQPCLDWGAGTGLFVRLCRDYGMNFFYSDPYAVNVFAAGFERDTRNPPPNWACVTAFEVAEHLPDPLNDFGELFKLSPRFILFSTLLYTGQAADWWYFTNNGQHVAFYTRRSLEIIAGHYGYRLASNDCDLHLFSRAGVRDGILNSCRKARERQSARYRKKHGSRIQSDFEQMQREETIANARG
jgi:Methyltransferase domain